MNTANEIVQNFATGGSAPESPEGYTLVKRGGQWVPESSTAAAAAAVAGLGAKGGTFYAADYGTLSATLPISHTAIQAAIDAAAVLGGTVVLPPQKMLLGASLVPRSGVSLRGIKPKTFSNTNTPDGNFNIIGGTRISYPGGVVFQQDTSASFATHQPCGQFGLYGIGFTNCLQIIKSGAQSKHGFWDSSFEDIVGDNITGTAFEFGNPQHIIVRTVMLNNPLRALHVYTNYRNAEVDCSPGNSMFIDFYASMSTAGGTVHDQPGVLLESMAGNDGFLGGLEFHRLQINRGNDGLHQGYNVELRAGSTPIVTSNFYGLDLEGSAQHAIHINKCSFCNFGIAGVSATPENFDRTLYATNSSDGSINSLSSITTLEFGDAASAAAFILSGVVASSGLSNNKAIGVYRDLSDSARICYRWSQYDSAKLVGDSLTLHLSGTFDISGTRIKRRIVSHTGGDLPDGYASDIIKLTTSGSTTAMPTAGLCSTECVRFINTSSGSVTITGVAGGDITLAAGSTCDVQEVSAAWYLVNKQGA